MQFRKIWWAVLAFTLVTFWVPIAGVLATCAHAKTVADYSEYTQFGKHKPTRED